VLALLGLTVDFATASSWPFAALLTQVLSLNESLYRYYHYHYHFHYHSAMLAIRCVTGMQIVFVDVSWKRSVPLTQRSCASGYCILLNLLETWWLWEAIQRTQANHCAIDAWPILVSIAVPSSNKHLSLTLSLSLTVTLSLSVGVCYTHT
jgi:hypothetical protein